MSTKNRFAKRAWVTIGGVAGLVAIIGIIVALVEYFDSQKASALQRIAQETQQIIQETQQSALQTEQSALQTQQSTSNDDLTLQVKMATQLGYAAEGGATGTAAAQEIKELFSTGESSQIVSAPATIAPSQTSVPPPTAIPLIAANRWYHKGEADWVTLRPDAASDDTLKSWGYSEKQLLFYAWLKPIPNGVAVYRWHHKPDGDWVTIVENSIPDGKLEEWGYGEKTFLFYASSEPVDGGWAVYRWFHPTEKDWVDVPDGYQPDDKLKEWGYKNKTFLFYAVRP